MEAEKQIVIGAKPRVLANDRGCVIRVPTGTHKRLKALSRATGRPIAEILTIAVQAIAVE